MRLWAGVLIGEADGGAPRHPHFSIARLTFKNPQFELDFFFAVSLFVGFNRSLNNKNNKSPRYMFRGLLILNYIISLKMILSLGVSNRSIYLVCLHGHQRLLESSKLIPNNIFSPVDVAT